MNEERFLHYLDGGRPRGSTKKMVGARDDSRPQNDEIKPLKSTHELYFARYSKRWGGGVAFIQEDDSQTLYRLYLLGKDQFKDVALQECGMEVGRGLEEKITLKRGDYVFNDRSWYGKIVFLGLREDKPIYTVTSPVDLREKAKEPSEAYLHHIIKGLKTTYKMKKKEILDYLMSKRGLPDDFLPTLDKLVQRLELKDQ